MEKDKPKIWGLYTMEYKIIGYPLRKSKRRGRGLDGGTVVAFDEIKSMLKKISIFKRAGTIPKVFYHVAFFFQYTLLQIAV